MIYAVGGLAVVAVAAAILWAIWPPRWRPALVDEAQDLVAPVASIDTGQVEQLKTAMSDTLSGRRRKKPKSVAKPHSGSRQARKK